ncbi:hypothetical protein P186_0348 [Pyrobaculum ferrireducens]|uniref:Uncharacterized protein n=1 Tax=Pyrobaculum ferrireducens TaxID=1104324 RepID=G7VFZ6_9CREN|nr:hypothetical protein P186_0348 [Pyrobaculum ferrireducens]
MKIAVTLVRRFRRETSTSHLEGGFYAEGGPVTWPTQVD